MVGGQSMISDPFVAEAEYHHFYYLVGKVVWYTQYLEDALCTFITAVQHEKTKVSHEEAYALLAKNKSKTLGKIVGEVQSRDIVPDGLDERLSHFVDERNWLVHRSGSENSSDLGDDAKRRALIERVRLIGREADLLYRELAKVLERWFAARGVDLGVADKIAREKVNNL
jgi:hypothetical protein